MNDYLNTDTTALTIIKVLPALQDQGFLWERNLGFVMKQFFYMHKKVM